MELARKLAILADAAKYDASCASSGTVQRNSRDSKGIGSTTGMGICHSYTPDGRCVSLLKILLTNFCIYDCLYCINRASSNVQRARFTPEEVVRLTLDFYRRNYIEGLFLSSGIIRSPDYIMEQVVAVARALRTEHQFRGYIHLKTIPEASPALIAEAGRWADRISINIELPTHADVATLAPQKNFANTQIAMSHIREKILAAKSERKENAKAPTFAPAGQSTQMIIGATPANDATILASLVPLCEAKIATRLLFRFQSDSRFIEQTAPLVAPPLVREHRLYQADWLIRFYGFKVEEIATTAAPNLDLAIDPKLSWALRNRQMFPVDLNRAPRELLLRVPGLGTKSVERILRLRRWHRLRLDDLPRLHLPMKKILPFVITADFNATALTIDKQSLATRFQKPASQLDLFPIESSVIDGQL